MNQEKEGQIVVYRLNDEYFAVNIMSIENIVKIPQITKVPMAPYEYDGVMNLRGEVIPVMNLKKKFKASMVDYPLKSSRIIIVKDDQNAITGLMVDEVMEVLDLFADDTKEVSYQEAENSKEYRLGLWHYEDQLISLLDYNRLLHENEGKEHK